MSISQNSPIAVSARNGLHLRHLLALALLLLAPLGAACGPENGDQGGGNGDGDDISKVDPAYYGLKERQCFHFDTNSGATLAINKHEKEVIRGYETWQMLWAINGQLWRDDFVSIGENDELLLHSREYRDGFATVRDRYDPPVVLLQRDMSENQTINNRNTEITRLVDRDRTKLSAQLFSTVARSKHLQEYLGEEREVTTLNVAWQTPEGQVTDEVEFVPQLGFVAIDGHGSEGDEATLVDIETLEEDQNCFPR